MSCMATLGEVQYICNAAVSQDGHKAVVAELYELGSTLVVTIHRVHKKRSAINAQLTYETSNQTPLDSIVVCVRVARTHPGGSKGEPVGQAACGLPTKSI